jgi:plasmid stability protein
MAKMIQVRDVPDRLHRELTKRARQHGLTLTGYVQQILEREVARPPVAEVLERIAARDPVELGVTAAELLRAERVKRRVS